MRFSFLLLVGFTGSMAISPRADDYAIRLLVPAKNGDVYSAPRRAKRLETLGRSTPRRRLRSFSAKVRNLRISKE